LKLKRIITALSAIVLIFMCLPFNIFAQNITGIEITFDDSYSQSVQIGSSPVHTFYINENTQKAKVDVFSVDGEIWINGNKTSSLEVQTSQNVTVVSINDNTVSYTIKLVKETNEFISQLEVKSYADDSLIESIRIADFNENNDEYFLVVAHNATSVSFYPELAPDTSFEVVGYEGIEYLLLEGKETVFSIIAGEKSFTVTIIVDNAPAVFDSLKTLEITALNEYNSVKFFQTHNYGRGEYKFAVPLSTEKIKLFAQLYNDKEAELYCNGQKIEQNSEIEMSSDSLVVSINSESGQVSEYEFIKTASGVVDIQNFFVEFYDLNDRLICTYSKYEALQNTDIILPDNYSYAILDAEFGGFVKNIELDAQKISLPYRVEQGNISLDVEFDDTTVKSFNLNFVNEALTPKLEYAYISFYDSELNPINEVLVNNQDSLEVPQRAKYFSINQTEADYDFGLSFEYNNSFIQANKKTELVDGVNLKIINGADELRSISFLVTQEPNSQQDITEGLIVAYNSHSVICYQQYFDVDNKQDIELPFDTQYFSVYFNAESSDSVITLDSKKAVYSDKVMYFTSDFKEKSYNFKIVADSGNEYDFTLNITGAEKAGIKAELSETAFDFYDGNFFKTGDTLLTEINDKNIVLLPKDTAFATAFLKTKENALYEITLDDFLINTDFYVNTQSKLKITVISEDRRSTKVYELEFAANNYLSGITVNSQAVSDFEKEKLDYSFNVEADVETAEIGYTLDDSSASAVLEGNSSLSYGKNTFTVTVTGWDNSQKVYTVNVYRLSSSIESSVYTVNEEKKLIYNLKDKLSVEAFVEKLSVSGAQIEVLDAKGQKVTTGNVATGMTVNAVSKGEILSSYTVLIYGDVNGSGTINVSDIFAIVKHSFGTDTLTGVKLLAGNANRDQNGKVNVSDILAIVYHSFGERAINQA